MEWILEQRKCNIKIYDICVREREMYWMCVCIVDSLCYRRLSIIGTSSYYSWRQREKKTKIKTHTTEFYEKYILRSYELIYI